MSDFKRAYFALKMKDTELREIKRRRQAATVTVARRPDEEDH